jgi:hypothetical protein
MTDLHAPQHRRRRSLMPSLQDWIAGACLAIITIGLFYLPVIF